jgi:hypothetical protein
MPNGLAISAFASGLGTGMQQASTLEKNKVETDTARLKLKRMEDEQGVIDKELQVRGARADFDLTENEFKKSMQDFENETRSASSPAPRAPRRRSPPAPPRASSSASPVSSPSSARR